MPEFDRAGAIVRCSNLRADLEKIKIVCHVGIEKAISGVAHVSVACDASDADMAEAKASVDRLFDELSATRRKALEDEIAELQGLIQGLSGE